MFNDFGDYWQHAITLEQSIPEERHHASLLGGEGACPPEDCGGPTEHEHVKMILSNPSHRDMRIWIGLKKNQHWNSEHFEPKKVAPGAAKV